MHGRRSYFKKPCRAQMQPAKAYNQASAHGARRLWIIEGFRGVVVGQAVEGEAAHGEGDGDPALALVGAAEVEVPEEARVAKLGRQAQGGELLVGLQVPEADRHFAA